MQNHIEFHDSKLLSVNSDGDGVRVTIDAFVHRWERVDGHWKGSGLYQLVSVIVRGGVAVEPAPLPADLYGGHIRAGSDTHPDLVPLPFSSSEAAVLELELMRGEVWSVGGSGIALEPVGEGRYVEDLPAEFAPPAC